MPSRSRSDASPGKIVRLPCATRTPCWSSMIMAINQPLEPSAPATEPVHPQACLMHLRRHATQQLQRPCAHTAAREWKPGDIEWHGQIGEQLCIDNFDEPARKPQANVAQTPLNIAQIRPPHTCSCRSANIILRASWQSATESGIRLRHSSAVHGRKPSDNPMLSPPDTYSSSDASRDALYAANPRRSGGPIAECHLGHTAGVPMRRLPARWARSAPHRRRSQ